MDVKNSLGPRTVKSRWELRRKLWVRVIDWIRLGKRRRPGRYLGVDFSLQLSIYGRSRIFWIPRSDPFNKDQIINQSNQATNHEISIQAGFPQSVLILDQNFPFSMIISIDRVPRPISPVIIFLPFPEDRLWRACLDTIRCVPSNPDHYLCLVILADDEAQKKCQFWKASNAILGRRTGRNLGGPNQLVPKCAHPILLKSKKGHG